MRGLEIALQIPDLWQQEAVRALLAGGDVVVDAPTGAGKTWVFELFAKGRKAGGGQLVYTVPTRALANDKYREWRAAGWEVGIATGDLAERLDAPVLVATLEAQRERLLSGDGPALLVVDEYQMIGDPQRGLGYEVAVALAPAGTQLLMLSGSVENPEEVVAWLCRIGRGAKLVRAGERPVPLEEMPVEELPRLPDKVGAFWPRVVAGACLADLSPLLLFAPRREVAENLARKIAAALPADDPIELPGELAARAGKPLCKLLRSRVAFHHSGLPYGVRAAVVEPLAKSGQLRVVVATTGLAAGINFSVRSVAITETVYREGAFLRELRADELLQMFGRAGRRGLDEVGYAIAARKTARLLDAAPLRLRRVNPVDWPTLLRVMGRASDRGDDPFAAAAEVCGRLFSRQQPSLGLEPGTRREFAEAGAELPRHFRGPRREEMWTPDGAWEPLPAGGESDHPLAEAWVHCDDRWTRALDCPGYVRGLGRGRLCRIGDQLGLEVKVGRLTKPRADGEPRQVLPFGWVKKAAGLGSGGRFSRREFEALVVPELAGHFEVGRFHRLVRRRGMLAAQMDLSGEVVRGFADSAGRVLVAPPRRSVAVEVDTRCEAGEVEVDPPAGSAAHSWRVLGLVDAGGHPTSRGRIASLFQGGEGLIVAAALEDESYPVTELAWHLANVRGGHRFREAEGGGSARLASAAREVYGMVDHPGYLELGLPPGYGEGAAEVLMETLTGSGVEVAGLGTGDIERARLEWLSLLRHITNAPEVALGRWGELAAEAAALLSRFGDDAGRVLWDVPVVSTGGRRGRTLRRSDFGR